MKIILDFRDIEQMDYVDLERHIQYLADEIKKMKKFKRDISKRFYIREIFFLKTKLKFARERKNLKI